ncbi:hypothetical protein PILCRDRAFT_366462 [Piloderma croceum F 1598]|uniref:Uncharacterized protein n=1 Tax=Piloderma croceum (strain F 1598) TaxID=765440 RepID=A0A0C3G076_PILCF|nr:hypothetical protein PILCRDRAFT_366462 [Piloderma croceum F 1598]
MLTRCLYREHPAINIVSPLGSMRCPQICKKVHNGLEEIEDKERQRYERGTTVRQVVSRIESYPSAPERYLIWMEGVSLFRIASVVRRQSRSHDLIALQSRPSPPHP